MTPRELGKVPENLPEENRILGELAHGAERAYKKIKDAPHESHGAAREQAQKILDKIHSAYTNYDISQALHRAESEGISLMDTIEEAYAEIFEKRIKKNYKNITEQEKAILKNQIIEMVTNRFQDSFSVFSDKEEQEIFASINELPDQLKMKLQTELTTKDDTHIGKIEKNFKKYIEPLIASKIIRETRPEEMPGLLHIDTNPIEQKNQTMAVKKKKGSVSGFFKRLFG